MSTKEAQKPGQALFWKHGESVSRPQDRISSFRVSCRAEIAVEIGLQEIENTVCLVATHDKPRNKPE